MHRQPWQALRLWHLGLFQCHRIGGPALFTSVPDLRFHTEPRILEALCLCAWPGRRLERRCLMLLICNTLRSVSPQNQLCCPARPSISRWSSWGWLPRDRTAFVVSHKLTQPTHSSGLKRGKWKELFIRFFASATSNTWIQDSL